MKKSKMKKDPEGYYAIAAVCSVIISIAIHWIFLSEINLPSTIHATIGIIIFFLLSALLSPILSRFW